VTYFLFIPWLNNSCDFIITGTKKMVTKHCSYDEQPSSRPNLHRLNQLKINLMVNCFQS